MEGIQRVMGALKGFGRGTQPNEQRPAKPIHTEHIPAHQPVPITERSVSAKARRSRKEQQRPAAAKEDRRAFFDAMDPQQIYNETGQMLQELQALAPHLSEEACNYLEGYRNEFDSLSKEQLSNIQHHLETIAKNERQIASFKKFREQTATDLARLESTLVSPKDQEETQEIIGLAQHYGLFLDVAPGTIENASTRLRQLEALHQHLQAHKQSSIKVNILLVKCRKQAEEDHIFGTTLHTMRERYDTQGEEMVKLNKQNEQIDQQVLF